MVTKAKWSVGAATFLSAFALVVACSSDDVTIPPPSGTDSGASSSGSTSSSGSSGDNDGSTTKPDSSTTNDSGSDSGGTSNAPTPSAACIGFADAYCDLFLRCYQFFLGGLKDDQASCKARAALGCALAEASPGGAQAAPTCSTAIKAAQCSTNVTNIDPSCNIKGTLPDTSPCEYDGQCTSGSCPKKGGAGPCFTCKPRVLVNGSCATAECDWGLQCAEGTCVTPVALNGTCTKGKCQAPNRCVAGTCQAPQALDSNCTSPGATFDDPCNGVNGQYCKPSVGAVGKCTAIAFADPGAACGLINGLLTGCKGLASCKQSKCVTNAADGAACNTTSGPDCSGPAECLNGICTFPKPDRCK